MVSVPSIHNNGLEMFNPLNPSSSGYFLPRLCPKFEVQDTDLWRKRMDDECHVKRLVSGD